MKRYLLPAAGLVTLISIVAFFAYQSLIFPAHVEKKTHSNHRDLAVSASGVTNSELNNNGAKVSGKVIANSATVPGKNKPLTVGESALTPLASAMIPLTSMRDTKLIADVLRQIQSDTTISVGQQAVGSAIALSGCAFIAGRQAVMPEAIRRARPDNEHRRLAWETAERTTAPERCVGVRLMEYSAEAIAKQWAIAAQAGDARGVAALIDIGLRAPEKVMSTTKVGDVEIKNWNGPSQSEVQTLFNAMSMKDPAFIQAYGRMFSESYADMDFVFGPKGEKLTMDNMFGFWNLVSCYVGADCSTNQRGVAAHCAETGDCYSSYQEYFQNTSTPEDWAQIERLLPLILNAINTGNWDGVVTRMSPPSGLEPVFNNQDKNRIRLRPPTG